MHAFRKAVEARDLNGMLAELSPDVVFHSPVTFKPYVGAEQVGWILATVATIFEDFTYIDELTDKGHTMLRFRTRIGKLDAEGVDLVELDDAGRIAKFTVMIRPMSAVLALAEVMRARFSAQATTR